MEQHTPGSRTVPAMNADQMQAKAAALIAYAERVSEGGDFHSAELRALVGAAFEGYTMRLLFGDLLDATRAISRWREGSDFDEHEEEDLLEARDDKLWPLLHGLPGTECCTGCCRRGRPVHAQNRAPATTLRICDRCVSEGLDALQQAIANHQRCVS